MYKKIILMLITAFSLSMFLCCVDAGLAFAAPAVPAVPKKVIADKDVAKLVELLGIPKSKLLTYDLDTPAALRIYSAAFCSGNDFNTVYESSDYGVNIAKFYKRNNITLSVQAASTAKFTKLTAEFNKGAFTADTYAGINQKAVAQVLASKLGVSKAGIIEYGFGSGVPFADILPCAAVACYTGNSLNVIFEKRKKGDNMEIVYENYASGTQQRAAIAALVTKYTEDVAVASKEGIKAAGIDVTPDLATQVERLARFTGTPKVKILEELKNGNPLVDIRRAIVITKKLTAEISVILKIKNEGGWKKVNEYYGLSGAGAQAELTKIDSDLSAKMASSP